MTAIDRTLKSQSSITLFSPFSLPSPSLSLAPSLLHVVTVVDRTLRSKNSVALFSPLSLPLFFPVVAADV